MPTRLELTPQKIAVYRSTALKRRQQEQAEIRRRRERAWQAAKQAAQLLRTQFNVSRVVIFGSLARGTGFTRWSDVDIAAWDIAPQDTFRAIGAVLDLTADIPVNLVDVNTTRASFLAAIEREGIEI